MERVFGTAAVGGRVRERADRLEELNDRTGPSVRHDQWQRVLVLRLHVDEMDVDSVDRGEELRERVQSRLAAPPVVVIRPVARELFDRGELNALRAVVDEFTAGQAGVREAALQVTERVVGD